MTFVNKTDMTFNHVVDEKDTPKTVRPVKLCGVANSTESRYMRVYTGRAGVRVGARQPFHQRPNAYGSMTVNGQTVERKNTQGVNEHDTPCPYTTLVAYMERTITEKISSHLGQGRQRLQLLRITLVLPCNTYVYTNGQMVPVAKRHESFPGMLERNKDKCGTVFPGVSPRR